MFTLNAYYGKEKGNKEERYGVIIGKETELTTTQLRN